MAFGPKDWRNAPETTTPIDAAALEDQEARVAAYAERRGALGGLPITVFGNSETFLMNADHASIYYTGGWVNRLAGMLGSRIRSYAQGGATLSAPGVGDYLDSASNTGNAGFGQIYRILSGPIFQKPYEFFHDVGIVIFNAQLLDGNHLGLAGIAAYSNALRACLSRAQAATVFEADGTGPWSSDGANTAHAAVGRGSGTSYRLLTNGQSCTFTYPSGAGRDATVAIMFRIDTGDTGSASFSGTSGASGTLSLAATGQIFDAGSTPRVGTTVKRIGNVSPGETIVITATGNVRVDCAHIEGTPSKSPIVLVHNIAKRPNWSWFGNYDDSIVNQYNAVTQVVCNEFANAVLMDVDARLNKDPQYWGIADNIHYSEVGFREVALLALESLSDFSMTRVATMAADGGGEAYWYAFPTNTGYDTAAGTLLGFLPLAYAAMRKHRDGTIEMRGGLVRDLNTSVGPRTTLNVTGGITLPTATITVVSTTPFPASGTLKIGANTVTYTGKTATTFTGCTGGTGAIGNGASIVGAPDLTLPTGTITVADTTGFPTSGKLHVGVGANTNGQVVTYTGKTTTTFTGCTGGTGTFPSRDTLIYAPWALGSGIAILPPGYRPQYTKHFTVAQNNNGTYGIGIMQIQDTGVVQYLGNPAASLEAPLGAPGRAGVSNIVFLDGIRYEGKPFD